MSPESESPRSPMATLTVVEPLLRPGTGRSRSNTATSVLSDSGSIVILPEEEPATWRERLSYKQPLVRAGLHFASLFIASFLVLFFCIKVLLPPVSPEDAPKLKIPRSFADLKGLNEVLQVYKQSNWWEVLGTFTLVDLFLVAFSLPGSMVHSSLFTPKHQLMSLTVCINNRWSVMGTLGIAACLLCMLAARLLDPAHPSSSV